MPRLAPRNNIHLTTYVWVGYVCDSNTAAAVNCCHSPQTSTRHSPCGGEPVGEPRPRHDNPPRLISSKNHSNAGCTHMMALLLMRSTADITHRPPHLQARRKGARPAPLPKLIANESYSQKNLRLLCTAKSKSMRTRTKCHCDRHAEHPLCTLC